ncbi:MAG: hypothetical protein UIL37_01640 [Clostridia bacterium]|nr:hypothetical protein [Clostridia bacterium]
MKDIMSMLRSMDKQQLNDAVKKAQDFIKTEEGKKTMEKLRRGETIDSIPISSKEQSDLISALSENPEAVKKIAEIFGVKG